MNTLIVALVVCLAVSVSARPGGIWGGHGWGAWDDGQWHGEGLVESQDWAGHVGHGGVLGAHGAAIIAPAAAVVGHGLGLGLGLGLGHGHGAVIAGPAGAVVANAVHGGIALGHGHW